MVVLVCGKDKLETTAAHAQDILWIQKQMKHKGWELSQDSPYQYVNNALIKRPDTGDCKAKKSTKGVGEGSGASKQAPVPHGNDTPKE